MSDLSEDLENLMGKNATQQQVSCWLDTGFAPLNKAISGSFKNGLPVGRIVEMFGGSSTGKTAIATYAMINAQRLGGIAAYMDHENSFDAGLAVSMGLDPTKGWVYKTPETFEESVDTAVKLGRGVRAERLVAPDAPIIVVFDSLASMVPQSKLYDAKGALRGTDSYNMHDNTALARCTSACFPALAQMTSKHNMLLLFLNQIRTKPGVAYGDPTTTPGGNAPEFYSSVRISLTRSMLKKKEGGEKVVSGQDIRAFLKKNKVSAPFKEARWRFMFREDGSGYFDTIYSTLEYMKETSLLPTSGAYVEWEGKKFYLEQLADKIREDGRYNDLLNILYATEA